MNKSDPTTKMLFPNAVIQQQQDRDRYNAERKAKRLENPSREKNSPSL